MNKLGLVFTNSVESTQNTNTSSTKKNTEYVSPVPKHIEIATPELIEENHVMSESNVELEKHHIISGSELVKNPNVELENEVHPEVEASASNSHIFWEETKSKDVSFNDISGNNDFNFHFDSTNNGDFFKIILKDKDPSNNIITDSSIALSPSNFT